MPLARMSMFGKGVEIYIALEGRCFVLGCNQFFTKSMYPDEYQSLLENEPENLCPGGSVIVSPLGKITAGPLFDKPGTVIADLDLEQITMSKLDLDVAGHYSRDDIFRFEVENQPDIKKEKLP